MPGRATRALALRATVMLALIAALSGCGAYTEGFGFEGTQRYSGPASVIAVGEDQGVDATPAAASTLSPACPSATAFTRRARFWATTSRSIRA